MFTVYGTTHQPVWAEDFDEAVQGAQSRAASGEAWVFVTTLEGAVLVVIQATEKGAHYRAHFQAQAPE